MDCEEGGSCLFERRLMQNPPHLASWQRYGWSSCWLDRYLRLSRLGQRQRLGPRQRRCNTASEISNVLFYVPFCSRKLPCRRRNGLSLPVHRTFDRISPLLLLCGARGRRRGLENAMRTSRHGPSSDLRPRRLRSFQNCDTRDWKCSGFSFSSLRVTTRTHNRKSNHKHCSMMIQRRSLVCFLLVAVTVAAFMPISIPLKRATLQSLPNSDFARIFGKEQAEERMRENAANFSAQRKMAHQETKNETVGEKEGALQDSIDVGSTNTTAKNKNVAKEDQHHQQADDDSTKKTMHWGKWW